MSGRQHLGYGLPRLHAIDLKVKWMQNMFNQQTKNCFVSICYV